MDNRHCATCGRPRGIAVLRPSWSINLLPIVPRTGNAEDKPSQITNDLIVHAGAYRNGGTDQDTHLCDDCLRIGLRVLKVHIDELLGDQSGANAELAALTQLVGRLQHRLHNTCFAHNRMQDRLRDILDDTHKQDEGSKEMLRSARWEVSRGHVKAELD